VAIFWSSDRSALKRPFADLAEEIGVRRQQSFAGGNRHRDAIAGEWLHLKVASWRSRPKAVFELEQATASKLTVASEARLDRASS
jgi:hypothetical protein